MKRAAGVLLPIFSLPSDYGIGTFGEEAYHFVDFLVEAKQTYWQILPLGQTSYGDSPYQSFSSYAGNPYFIDLDFLCNDGYLKKSEYQNIDWGNNDSEVDYGKLYENRLIVLKKAARRLIKENNYDYLSFKENEKSWLLPYAWFMHLKHKNHEKGLVEWNKKDRDYYQCDFNKSNNEVELFQAIQYFFFKQWYALKEYANSKGLLFIGDIPIYVAEDSVEVWKNPELFQLDENLKPIRIAGCPPDGYTEDGQRWGNPLYRWDVMANDGYDWWINRIAHQLRFFDILRLDHFRGFAGYYSIDAKEKTARNGCWEKGPGYDLFSKIKERLGDIPIIAEDLGFLTDDVYELLNQTGYPGMKNMLFAFDANNLDSEYLPHNFTNNCVAYVSTHDSEPLMGWFEVTDKANKKLAEDYIKLTKKEGYNWGFMRCAYSSIADTVITQFQDFLALGNEARINIPASETGNWKWRLKKGQYDNQLAQKMKHMIDLYRR